MKNYQFNFSFGGAWGTCEVTVTSVIGHLTGLDFEPNYKGWTSCPPSVLFEAPVVEAVAPVRTIFGRPEIIYGEALTATRRTN